ncbi:MAG: hypothetical protein CME62_16220 [Halobacteriovoraceae bacterium]|nr:hypothetical protein [Halobacteriovoraceae bacterium]|tara:strand:+ start:5818 stop:6357 length:540 start_codon:yes stop_codon:yes gene_type:complete
MSKDKIITATHSLNEFFFHSLSKKNKEVPCPLPEEFLFYSSLVLERYAMSENFFALKEGKINEKIFGLKFLQSQKKENSEKVNDLKDVGDTLLVQLGLFSDSVKNKLTNKNYYVAIAQNAYHQLDGLEFQFYDIPNFYRLFASSFERTLVLLEAMSADFLEGSDHQFLLDLESENKKAI